MNPFLSYDVFYHEIPEQDLPEVGQVFICKDPQKRLGETTWSVIMMGNGTHQLGLFWSRENAEIFAKALDEMADKK